ncbi:MAG TPA: HAD-IIIC family phosphatase [Aestuariivirga sp.]|nr:HAD-IIIC family phosphatase [Aestuariivirga sp.]
MRLCCGKSEKLEAFFHKEQIQIASRFAKISTIIPRWQVNYRRASSVNQLDTFIAEEFLVYPQYLEKAFASGDGLWLNLYIGEMKKLGHATDGNFEVAHKQVIKILDNEIAFLTAAVDKSGFKGEHAKLSSAFEQIRSVVSCRANGTLNVLWIADCLYLDVQSFLAADLASEFLNIRPDLVTSKNPSERYERTAALLQSNTYDAIFYCPFSYENSAAYTRLLDHRHAVSNVFSAARFARDETQAIEMMLRLLTGQSECPVVVHNASGAMRHSGGMKETVKDALTRPARMSYCRTVNPLLGNLVAQINFERSANRISILDEFSIAKENGLRDVGTYFHTYGQQHPARLGLLLSASYLDTLWIIHNLQKKKLIVCDLDNTLWSGVIGESTVSPHLDRQAILKSLKEKGILLAVNSKNNPANVTWSGGVLSEEDFACMRINWQTKVENIGEIVDEMNLKSNSFMFIDDRADERAIVSSVYPEIVVLDANDPAVWRRLALWARMVNSTAEMDRTKMYRERQKREAFVVSSSKHSVPDLFQQLELKCIVSLSESKSLPRIVELINRTNQFNTTGRKTSLKEVVSWHEQPEWAIYTAAASDRFGDMGIVGVLVTHKVREHQEIEVFVLSCRVFGYGIETAILNAVIEVNSGQTISGIIMPTPVNQPCQLVYSDHHFSPRGDRYIYDQTSVPIVNKQWLHVEDRCPPPTSSISPLVAAIS